MYSKRHGHIIASSKSNKDLTKRNRNKAQRTSRDYLSSVNEPGSASSETPCDIVTGQPRDVLLQIHVAEASGTLTL